MPLNQNLVRQLVPSRAFEWHSSLDSTMRIAAERALAGAETGFFVGADEQTAGQGRLGRSWHSEPDTGLYFSIILRPAVPALTLALGLAAVEAIRVITHIDCDLRWPNDVLVGDRKVAGILTQVHGGAAVAGIGINVNQQQFPPDLASIATSLRLISGHDHPREALLIALLDDIDMHVDILTRQGHGAIFDLYTHASTYVSGRRVTVDLPEGPVTGTTAGLTEAGYLRLRRDDGREVIIVAGGVRPCS